MTSGKGESSPQVSLHFVQFTLEVTLCWYTMATCDQNKHLSKAAHVCVRSYSILGTICSSGKLPHPPLERSLEILREWGYQSETFWIKVCSYLNKWGVKIKKKIFGPMGIFWERTYFLKLMSQPPLVFSCFEKLSSDNFVEKFC